jgi:hypothetical protein
MRVAISLVLAACLVTPLSAQVPDPWRAGLPRDVARRIERLIRDTTTVQKQGDARIGPTDRIEGNVVSWDGTLTVAGQVSGEVVVLRGNVVLESGAAVNGDITVVDGFVSGMEIARVGGSVMEYQEGFGREAERTHRQLRAETPFRTRSSLSLGIEGNYNRVEGLPLRIGPDIRTGGRNPLRIRASAILRTEPDFFDTHQMGYRVMAEQRIPASGGVWLGARAFSAMEPIESWSFTDLEATFAASLFHEDLRDYYERTGWSAYLRFSPNHAPIDLTIEYGSEEHETATLHDPWSLFRRENRWRLMPLAAEGELRLVRAAAELDLRDGSDFRTRGWLLRAQLTRSVRGEIVTPAFTQIGPEAFTSPQTSYSGFTTGLIDLRRYQPIGYDGVLGLRVVAAGNIKEAPLPPQFQNTLGGAGSLPGYPAFRVDCGARAIAAVPTDLGNGQPFFASYGCDRIALAQVEYRGGFGIHFDDDDDLHWNGWNVDMSPDWIVFFDAGRAWSYSGAGGPGVGRTLKDAGVGIVLGGIGVFGAVPLTGEDRPLRLFVRLGPRF